MSANRVLVVDLDGEISRPDFMRVNWSDRHEEEYCISIPKLVEEHSEALRSQYLEWVALLGMAEVNGTSLVELLKIRDNLSYWWMSLISEKCNYAQSPHITDAIKMMAFDVWANENLQIKFLELHSDNFRLAKCMRIWCDSKGIQFKWDCSPKKKLQLSRFLGLSKLLPPSIRAFGWLVKYCIDRWPLRGVGLAEWTNLDGEITFFSYFCNLSPIQKENSAFSSNYWTQLPDEISKRRLKVRWLHIYIKDKIYHSAYLAAKQIRLLNAGKNEAHVTLDAFLTTGTLFKSLSDWLGVLKLKKNILSSVKKIKCGGLDLYPLFMDEWAETLSGPNLLSNCLYVNLFEMAVSVMPNQNLGIYLFEQQPWEFALLSAWKRKNHKGLIGFQHTTVPFWDLRYFFDPSIYMNAENLLLPMPTLVAVNGPISYKTFSEAGFPRAALAEVEALRFLHLNKNMIRVAGQRNEPLRILVLADYLESGARSQLKLLDCAKSLSSFDIQVMFKSHPASAGSSLNLHSKCIEVTHEPLEILLKKCDLVFTSAVTSAAVEAYLAGIPVISVMDSKTLNLSPLRGVSGVYFINDKVDLSNALSIIRMGHNVKPVVPTEFFHLDSDLRRWMSLISTFIDL